MTAGVDERPEPSLQPEAPPRDETLEHLRALHDEVRQIKGHG